MDKAKMAEKAAEYSTKVISPTLVKEVIKAVQDVGGYGSVELYIQDSKVTQITTRKLHKTV